MKIVHVYARNLKIFEEALEGTGCRINGCFDSAFMAKSFTQFNVRDVMGLIVFRRHMTKKLLKMIRAFDNLFMFSPLPVVVVCDEAEELVRRKILKVKYSSLFVINSVEGTISDVDLKRIFTTLACVSGEMYELRDIELAHAVGKESSAEISAKEKERTVRVANEVLAQLKELGEYK